MDNSQRVKVALKNKTFKEIDLINNRVIGYDLFSGRTEIIEVHIPEGVEVIEGNSFEGCTSLVKVELPTSIREIGSEAFADCKNLTSINVPDNAKVSKTAFIGCNKLKR